MPNTPFDERAARVERDFDHFLRIRSMLSTEQKRVFISPIFDETKSLLDEVREWRYAEGDLEMTAGRLADIYRELRSILGQR
jgi:hypothetical protein